MRIVNRLIALLLASCLVTDPVLARGLKLDCETLARGTSLSRWFTEEALSPESVAGFETGRKPGAAHSLSAHIAQETKARLAGQQPIVGAAGTRVFASTLLSSTWPLDNHITTNDEAVYGPTEEGTFSSEDLGKLKDLGIEEFERQTGHRVQGWEHLKAGTFSEIFRLDTANGPFCLEIPSRDNVAPPGKKSRLVAITRSYELMSAYWEEKLTRFKPQPHAKYTLVYKHHRVRVGIYQWLPDAQELTARRGTLYRWNMDTNRLVPLPKHEIANTLAEIASSFVYHYNRDDHSTVTDVFFNNGDFVQDPNTLAITSIMMRDKEIHLGSSALIRSLIQLSAEEVLVPSEDFVQANYGGPHYAVPVLISNPSIAFEAVVRGLRYRYLDLGRVDFELAADREARVWIEEFGKSTEGSMYKPWVELWLIGRLPLSFSEDPLEGQPSLESLMALRQKLQKKMDPLSAERRQPKTFFGSLMHSRKIVERYKDFPYLQHTIDYIDQRIREVNDHLTRFEEGPRLTDAPPSIKPNPSPGPNVDNNCASLSPILSRALWAAAIVSLELIWSSTGQFSHGHPWWTLPVMGLSSLLVAMLLDSLASWQDTGHVHPEPINGWQWRGRGLFAAGALSVLSLFVASNPRIALVAGSAGIYLGGLVANLISIRVEGGVRDYIPFPRKLAVFLYKCGAKKFTELSDHLEASSGDYLQLIGMATALVPLGFGLGAQLWRHPTFPLGIASILYLIFFFFSPRMFLLLTDRAAPVPVLAAAQGNPTKRSGGHLLFRRLTVGLGVGAALTGVYLILKSVFERRGDQIRDLVESEVQPLFLQGNVFIGGKIFISIGKPEKVKERLVLLQNGWGIRTQIRDTGNGLIFPLKPAGSLWLVGNPFIASTTKETEYVPSDFLGNAFINCVKSGLQSALQFDEYAKSQVSEALKMAMELPRREHLGLVLSRSVKFGEEDVFRTLSETKRTFKRLDHLHTSQVAAPEAPELRKRREGAG